MRRTPSVTARTLRSSRDRRLLWQVAGGMCQACGDPLGDNWEADHIKPWVKTKRTNPHEMQALCQPCNRRKGARDSMETQQRDTMDLTAARPGQRSALRTILTRITAGEQSTSIILPTGYGKSDVMRLAAIQLYDEGQVARSLIVEQSDTLRGQVVRSDKVDEMLRRYKVRLRNGQPIHCGEILGRDTRFGPNGECILAVNTQLIQRNISDFTRWIESVRHTTGKRVVVFIDEVDTHAAGNEWGRAMLALRDEGGASLVVLTATAMREDGDAVICFKTKQTGAEGRKVWKYLPGESEDTVIVQEYDGVRTYYDLEADYEYTFQAAWDEDALCHMDTHTIDVDVSYWKNGVETPQRRLSEITGTDLSLAIAKAVRDPKTIHAMCAKTIACLRARRATPGPYGNCAAIIFCPNDEDGERNLYPNKVRSVCQAIDPSLHVVIATSADGDGKKILEDFSKYRVGDILVCKAMAGRGLDVDRIKVGCELSATRKPRAFIQRANRTTRPYHTMLTADFITLADAYSVGFIKDLITNQGGHVAIDDLTLQRQWEQEKRKIEEGTSASIHDIHTGATYDTRGHMVAPDDHGKVDRFFEKMPHLSEKYTHGAVLEILDYAVNGDRESKVGGKQDGSCANQSDDPYKSVNTSDSAKSVQDEITLLVKEIVKNRFRKQYGRPYSKEREGDGQLFKEVHKATYEELRSAITYDRDLTPRKITDVALLNDILTEFKRIEARDKAQAKRSA